MAPPLAIGSVTLGARPRLVAAGGEAEVDALAGAAGADLVELRADMFDDATPAAVVAALTRLRAGGRPIILTVRAGAEGGRPLEEARRRAIYGAGLPLADAIDVEIASTALAAGIIPQARTLGRTVILSAHALAATPPAPALFALIDRAAALGGDVTKLATHAGGLDDLRTLLEVTLVARGRGLVTLAMGPMGPLSRLVLPAAGSLLAYGHVGRETAPGQLGVGELAALYERFFPA